MTKKEGRDLLLTRRKALLQDELETCSQQISQRLFEQDWLETITTLHTFLPILRQKEVDTWPTIRRLWQNYPHIRVAVPVTDVTKHQLTHYELTPVTTLVQNQWGVPEPISEQSLLISPKEIDLVLVPLLGFDLRGHRIGYGGGFYDRFLAMCRPDCYKVGLSLFEPVEFISDTLPTDIALDFVCTPNYLYTIDKIKSRFS